MYFGFGFWNTGQAIGCQRVVQETCDNMKLAVSERAGDFLGSQGCRGMHGSRTVAVVGSQGGDAR